MIKNLTNISLFNNLLINYQYVFSLRSLKYFKFLSLSLYFIIKKAYIYMILKDLKI